MLDSSLYLVGLEQDNSYVNNPAPCSICKRLIINAGIKDVYVRISKYDYIHFFVKDWTKNNIIGGY